MARLNEATPATESIDAVKRRFMRQNRDLAKNNSAQSLRIRNLETESSRLLAENLSLRERLLQLEAQVEQYRHLPSPDEINRLKNKLKSKLEEFGHLVAELQFPQGPSPSDAKPSSQATSPPRRRYCRENPEFYEEEVLGGRLPTITEDKHYPRKTLDAQDICKLMESQSSNSPTLSPPPVSQFQHDDPIKFNRESILKNDRREHDGLEIEGIPPSLAINLETRRKRRDSQGKLDLQRIPIFQSPPESKADVTNDSDDFSKTIRKGSKRKLSARDDEPSQDGKSNPRQDDTLRRSSYTTASSNTYCPTTDSERKLAPRLTLDAGRVSNPDDAPPSPRRKVLGHKPVNTDPVLSPKKQLRGNSNGQKSSDVKNYTGGKLSSGAASRQQKTRAHAVTLDPPPLSNEPNVVNIYPDLTPETPAALELLAPISTEPSATRRDTNDTPPPGHLDLSSTSHEQPTGRVARRARVAVNYAEPNLVSKMRRPTEKLADAVARNGRLSNNKLEESDLQSANQAGHATDGLVKTEEGVEAPESWKLLSTTEGIQELSRNEPGSPLTRKTVESGRNLTKPINDAGHVGGSSAAISALMAGSTASRKRTQSSSKSTTSLVTDRKSATSLSRSGSTSVKFALQNSDTNDEQAGSEGATTRATRRHSSISSLASRSSGSMAPPGRPGNNTTHTQPDREVKFGVDKSARLGRVSMVADNNGVDAERLERIASRRRSMML